MRWECRIESGKQYNVLNNNARPWWRTRTYEGGNGGGNGGGGGGGCTTLLAPSFCEISWGTGYGALSNGLPAPPSCSAPPLAPSAGGEKSASMSGSSLPVPALLFFDALPFFFRTR